MGSIATIVIETDYPPAKLEQDLLNATRNPRTACVRISNYLAGLGVARHGKVVAYVEDDDGTAANNTVTCTQSSVSNGDTVVVAGVTLTVAAAPSGRPEDGEFAAGASDDACGANLAAAINAHPRLKGLVSAANSSGTVTITAAIDGVWGNLVTLAETGTGFAIGGGGSALESGAAGTVEVETRAFRRGLA